MEIYSKEILLTLTRKTAEKCGGDMEKVKTLIWQEAEKNISLMLSLAKYGKESMLEIQEMADRNKK